VEHALFLIVLLFILVTPARAFSQEVPCWLNDIVMTALRIESSLKEVLPHTTLDHWRI